MPQDWIALLKANGFQFHKSLGQNFLVNPDICPRIAAASGVGSADGALEIGAGAGVLTRELSARAETVLALELDRRLEPVLQQTLANCPNVRLLFADVLQADFPALLAEHFAPQQAVHVCANLPYYITSPVIMRLLEAQCFASITVMVQKEAAERLCAAQGSRNSGSITLAVAYYAAAEKCFSVSRGSFLPVPNVDSTVIRLTPHRTPPVLCDREALFRVIHAAFGQRRKTLLNALSAGLELPKPVVADMLRLAEVSETARAENLTLAEFAAVVLCL